MPFNLEPHNKEHNEQLRSGFWISKKDQKRGKKCSFWTPEKGPLKQKTIAGRPKCFGLLGVKAKKESAYRKGKTNSIGRWEKPH